MKDYVWCCLFLSLCIFDSTAINLCESSQEGGFALTINGSFSYATQAKKTCRCVLTTTVSANLKFQYFTVPVENRSSELRVTNTNGSTITIVCQTSDIIEVGVNNNLDVVLTMKLNPENTIYRIEVSSGYGNVTIQATCYASLDVIVTNISTSTDCITHIPNQSTSTTTQLEIMKISTLPTVPIPSSSTLLLSSMSTTKANSFLAADDKILYYAIGGGVGGAAVVIIVIVTVILYRRCLSKESREKEKTHANEVDELQYNVLYESAVNDDNDTNTANREGQSYVPCDEETYTTVNLEDASKTLNMNNLNENNSLPCNHSKGEPATTSKTKRLVMSEDNVNQEKSLTKHVIAPGDEGCEYAVVNKQGINIEPSHDAKTRLVGLKSSNENTYAVVDKNRKQKEIEINI